MIKIYFWFWPFSKICFYLSALAKWLWSKQHTHNTHTRNMHTRTTHTTCTHSHKWEHTPTNTHDHTLESRHMYSHAQINIHMGTHTRMPAHILTHTLSQIHTSKHTQKSTDTRTAQSLSPFLFLTSISLIQSSFWCFLPSTSFSSYLSSFLKRTFSFLTFSHRDQSSNKFLRLLILRFRCIFIFMKQKSKFSTDDVRS